MKNRMILFYATTALFWFALYAYVPYVAPYAENMRADDRMIGLIVGAYGITQMIIRFPLGIISDILGRRKIFIISGLCFAAVNGLIVYIFPTPLALLAARALAGVAASSWVIFTILGASYGRAEDTVKTVSFMSACNSFGRMAALLIGGIVAGRMGFPYAFLLAAGAGAVGIVLGFGIKEKRPETTKTIGKLRLATLLETARNRQLLCASLLAIFVQYISFATTFGFTPLVASNLGASNYQLGLLGMLGALPGLFIAPLAGTVLPRKFGIRNTLMAGFGLSVASCIAIPLINSIPQLFVIQIINNIGMNAVFTLLLGLCIRDIPNERRGSAMGFFQAVYGFGMFIGPFAMGQISFGFGLANAFFFTAGVGVLGIAASAVFVSKKFLKG